MLEIALRIEFQRYETIFIYLTKKRGLEFLKHVFRLICDRFIDSVGNLVDIQSVGVDYLVSDILISC